MFVKTIHMRISMFLILTHSMLGNFSRQHFEIFTSSILLSYFFLENILKYLFIIIIFFFFLKIGFDILCK